MPVHKGEDNKGSYYQYGHEKKYYYIKGDKETITRAISKAGLQARAIKTQQSKNK